MSSRLHTGLATAGHACLASIVTLVGGCATWTPPVDISDAPLRERAVTDAKRSVHVAAAVLGRDDSLRLFGTDLTAAGVQPVWVEVRNETEQALWLLRSGSDPDYFSPLEVAWSAHVSFGGGTNRRIDGHFDRMAFHNPIPPRGTSRGVLFTNPQPVTKLFNIDLLGDKTLIPFTLFLRVPGDVAPAGELIHRYPESEVVHCDDLELLRRALELLPCCASTKAAEENGEPLNVVLVGDLEDIGAAFVRRGYRRDPAARGDPQSVFGRPPDLHLRKRAQAGASENWLRIWRAPISYRGQFVFVAQAGRPVGGRYRPELAELDELHPDVDEARNALIHDLMYSGGLEKLAFVNGVGAAAAGQPRVLAGGIGYYTDGRRVTLFLGPRPLTISDVDIVDWEALPPPSTKYGAGKGSR